MAKPEGHGGLAIAAVMGVQSKGWVESCPPGERRVAAAGTPIAPMAN